MSQIKKTSTHYENKQTLSACCLDIYAFKLLEGQWALAICCALSNSKLRFAEIRRQIPNITERMLSLQLKKMETNSLVIRTAYAEVPLRVEYELTSSAKKLLPILDLFQEWGQQHKANISTPNN